MIQNDKLDLGCGPNKTEGHFGVDIHQYEGVDHVTNLNSFPWDLPDNQFKSVVCKHVIEHVEDFTGFMREMHRICADGCEIYFETPHFSSFNSWNDPTHRGHFSSAWYENFQPGHWMADQCGAFELIESKVTFGRALRNKIGKFLVALKGQRKWEKNSAFSFPGMDIQTRLKVIK